MLNLRRTLPLCLLLLVLECATASANAQAITAPPSPGASQATPAFDIAAIHINHSDESARSHIFSSPNDSHFRAINVPLKMLLQWAFVIPDSRIFGGPSWLGSTKFDIEAKSDAATDEQMRSLDSAAGKLQKQKMLQALLASRFKLQVHQESRELPIYSLVLTKDGPKFKSSQVNGTTVDGHNSEIRVKGSDDTVTLLADQLALYLGRPVVNDTGLHNRYELTLKWTPDQSTASTADTSLPSIFTAIEEQLGLKLIAKKGPVSVLVVDHAEMPSEN